MPAATPKRRARERIGQELDTLLNSITFDQLRTVLADISTGDYARPSTREDALEQIYQAGRAVGDIEEAAYLVEASTPFEHCFFATLRTKLTPLNAQKLIKRSVPRYGDYSLAFVSENSGVYVATFEHDVAVREWVTDEGGKTKHLATHDIRHPLIARIDSIGMTVVVTYPGISHGSGTDVKHRINYRDAVHEVLEYLRIQFGVTTDALPVRECITRLHEAESDRLVVLSASPNTRTGRIKIASSSKAIGADRVVSEWLLPHASEGLRKELRDASAKALRSSTLDSIVLYWRVENIFTRTDFWDIGAELYVIWHRVGRSFDVIKNVVDLFKDISQTIATPDRAAVWDAIAGTLPGNVLFPPEFASRFKLPADEIKSLFIDALKAHIVEPVYCINSTEDLLNPLEQKWTSEISSLRRTFMTVSHRQINGALVENIRVGFRRIVSKQVVVPATEKA